MSVTLTRTIQVEEKGLEGLEGKLMGYQVSLLDSSHRTHISKRNRRSCLLCSHLMFLAAAFHTGHSFYLCCLAFEILYILENTPIEETNVNEISTWQLRHAATRKLKNFGRNQIPLPAHLIISPYDNCFTLVLLYRHFSSWFQTFIGLFPSSEFSHILQLIQNLPICLLLMSLSIYPSQNQDFYSVLRRKPNTSSNQLIQHSTRPKKASKVLANYSHQIAIFQTNGMKWRPEQK